MSCGSPSDSSNTQPGTSRPRPRCAANRAVAWRSAAPNRVDPPLRSACRRAASVSFTAWPRALTVRQCTAWRPLELKATTAQGTPRVCKASAVAAADEQAACSTVRGGVDRGTLALRELVRGSLDVDLDLDVDVDVDVDGAAAAAAGRMAQPGDSADDFGSCRARS